MKKRRVLGVLLCLVLSVTALSACGGGDEVAPGQIELLIDMHGLMPTLNTEPTTESPTVILATRYIADQFMEENPDIKIKWARSKPVGGLEAEVSQWFVTQIAGDSCPAIAFSWGTQYQDRDYYVDMTKYYNEPNEYIEGNQKWSDAFDSYLFETSTVRDIKGQLVGVPVTLYAGPPTGWYYNKNLVADANVPQNWEQFANLVSDLSGQSGVTPLAPWSFFKKISLDNWVMQYSIGPAIANYIMDDTDYDKDGIVSTVEQLRAVKAGLYDPTVHDYAAELYRQGRRYFNDLLKDGWMNTDYTQLWNNGQVAMLEEGLWALYAQNSNAARDFEFGVFPAPLLDKETCAYAKDIEYTEKGPYQPKGDMILNIMKPAVAGKPELEAAAVKFLKYLTKPENITMIVEEQGSSLGAVKGASYNSILDDWLDQPFPKMPQTNWPIAFNSEQNDKLNRLFGEWVLGAHTDAEFFKKANDIQIAGADAYIKVFGIDTSGWN